MADPSLIRQWQGLVDSRGPRGQLARGKNVYKAASMSPTNGPMPEMYSALQKARQRTPAKYQTLGKKARQEYKARASMPGRKVGMKTVAQQPVSGVVSPAAVARRLYQGRQ